jgi:hypothetical protein
LHVSTKTTAIMKAQSILRISAVTAALLLVPFVAMQFTDEVNWSVSDFIIMGALIFSIGLATQFLMSRSANIAYRLGAGFAVLGTFLLIWVNLAVGLIGSGANAANLLYAVVPLAIVIGSVITRLQPRGMASTMAVAALAQIAVPIIAFATTTPNTLLDGGSEPAANVIGITGFFAALWIVSAVLFRRATKSIPEPSNS